MKLEEAFSQIEQYIRQGQKPQARALLREVIRQYPDIEEVWILSALVADKPGEVTYCLKQVLRINPDSPKALAMVKAYQQKERLNSPGNESFPKINSEPGPRITQPPPEPIPFSETQNAQQQPQTGSSAPAEQKSLFTETQPAPKYKVKWWMFLLLFVGVLLFLIGPVILNNYSSESVNYNKLQEWQLKEYGNVIPIDHYNEEFKRRKEEYRITVEHKELAKDAALVLALPSLGIFLLWFGKGVAGGIIFGNKKLRGRESAIILLLIPIVIFPVYLALTGVFGEWAYAWGKNAQYTNKQCPQCRAWIPREALRCQKCGQEILAVDGGFVHHH